ncbi:MAG: transglutaminase family protein, partial [Verrucomicrobiales bacterium]
KPNPVPIDHWLTIGALDPSKWKPLMGARWSQWAGVIYARNYGDGFGGRSICLYQRASQTVPYEVAVTVRLDSEGGAAGLAFASDGADVHYGFYPSAGNLRLTRFDGPDVYSWKVLEDVPAEGYRPGQWNRLRVRVEANRILCYVNGALVYESEDRGLRGGQVGLCKFRGTAPEFRGFEVGADLAPAPLPRPVIDSLESEIASWAGDESASEEILSSLLEHPTASRALLTEQAELLRRRAHALEELTTGLLRREIISELQRVLKAPEKKIDLFRAGLLVARLDNPELDVDGYCQEIDRMATELEDLIPCAASNGEQIATLNRYLFEERGYHGSRSAYYTRSNSYLNEVLDDHEGIPITLSILYMELARRAGVEGVVGIPLPSHFLVQHRPEKGRRPYIDVFDGGAL